MGSHIIDWECDYHMFSGHKILALALVGKDSRSRLDSIAQNLSKQLPEKKRITEKTQGGYILVVGD